MVRYIIEQLHRPTGSKIAALVASHGHLDHIGGCQEVLEAFDVERVFDSWYLGSDAPQSYRIFQDDVRDENTNLTTLEDDPSLDDNQVSQWDDLPLGSSSVRAQLVWPPGPVADWDDIAEATLGVHLHYGATTVCFHGDMETANEQDLVASAAGRDLDCDAILVTHHGSRYANGAELLALEDPEYAVVSFGENTYGHPTSAALCRVQRAGADVYATHRLGDIVLTLDGATVSIAPDAPETIDFCLEGANYWGLAPPPSQDENDEIHSGHNSTSASSSSAPSTPLQLAVTISNQAPCQNSQVTLSWTLTEQNGTAASGATVTSLWHYKSSTTSPGPGSTNAQGKGSVSRSIGSASAGYTVVVDVTAETGGRQASAQVSFTPQAC